MFVVENIISIVENTGDSREYYVYGRGFYFHAYLRE